MMNRQTSRPQNYQLSIVCPALSLKAARREIRAVAQGHGLRVSHWSESPVANEPGLSEPWRVATEFRGPSENCASFLQAVLQRLSVLNLARVTLDCVPLEPVVPSGRRTLGRQTVAVI